jgi:hypothetical protein
MELYRFTAGIFIFHDYQIYHPRIIINYSSNWVYLVFLALLEHPGFLDDDDDADDIVLAGLL